MNENLDLCKILEGCEGMELYSSAYGRVTFTDICNNQLRLVFHRKMASDSVVYYEQNGHLYSSITDDEITLFPSKDQRDWSKFEKPIKEDTPMMCSNFKSGWFLKYYCNYGMSVEGEYKHRVYADASKQYSSVYDFVIPYKKFDPTNIEESLKFNIQK